MTPLEQLFRSWRASEKIHTLSEGATVEEIESFEKEAGWRLPAEWREFYTLTNGVTLFGGEVRIAPLLGDNWSLIGKPQSYRENGWPIPDEMWPVGINGTGDPFGLWLPATTREVCPVVDMAKLFATECLAIAGSSLGAFLRLRTVYYLLLYRPEPEWREFGLPDAACNAALDILNVPLELRTLDPDDGLTWPLIGRWADPARPAGLDDPWLQRLSAKEINHKLKFGLP